MSQLARALLYDFCTGQVHAARAGISRVRIRRARLRLRPAACEVRRYHAVDDRLDQVRRCAGGVVDAALIFRRDCVPHFIMRADDVARAVEVVNETLTSFIVLRIAYGGDDRVHVAVGDLRLCALNRAIRAFKRDDAAHLLRVAADGGSVQIRVVDYVCLRAVEVAKRRQRRGRRAVARVVAVFGVLVRFQITIVNLAQPPAVFGAAVIGVAYHRTARRGDGGQQAVRVIRENGGAAYAVGDGIDLARNVLVIRQRHGVAVHVRDRRKVRSRGRGGNREAHNRVGLVRDGRGGVGYLQLELHALAVGVRLLAGLLKIVLGAVAVLPDVEVLADDRFFPKRMVHAQPPAKAAVRRVFVRKAAIINVRNRNGHAVAGSGRIRVLGDQVAVVDVGVHTARAAGAHAFVLPPALAARVGDVVHDDVRVALRRTRRIEVRTVVRRGARAANGDAVVRMAAVFLLAIPALVRLRDVEISPCSI